MIDPLRLANAINNQADDYATKSLASESPAVVSSYGTASLVLYALSIALHEALRPILHDQAQKEHDDVSRS